VTNPDRTGNGTTTSLYSEFSPRLSLGKISGKKLAFGPVKDVLLAGTVEMGNGFHNYLYGVGFSLDLPKFAFFDLNVYVRNALGQKGTTYQITPAWALPFSIGSAKLMFEGFADIAGSEGTAKSNIDFQPRLLLDVGNYMGSPDSIWLGVEYIYWHNKFGVDGVDEYAPQAMLKWVF
jgi:nucleoside-specific outer membrane channel protein Tsx